MATQIEKNTARLMLKKLQAKLDALFQAQEQKKAAEGKGNPLMTQQATPPMGQNMPQQPIAQQPGPMGQAGYADGGVVGNDSPTVDKETYELAKKSYFDYLSKEGKNIKLDNYDKKAMREAHSIMLSNMKHFEPSGKWTPLPVKDAAYQVGNTVRSWANSIGGTHYADGGMIPRADDGLNIPRPSTDKFGLNPFAGSTSAFTTAPTDLGQVPGGVTGYQFAQNQFANPTYPTTNNVDPVASTQTGGNGTPFNWQRAGQVGLGLLGAAPIAYNLAQGLQKPQVLNSEQFQNPYESQARTAMRNRRFNVRPLMERNLASQHAYNQNVRNVSSSRGELLSNYGAGYAGRLGADAQALAQKQNVDNQYLGEQAQMDAQLGAQRAAINLGVQNINDQNAAARRNFLAASAGQTSQYAQNQLQMWNQRIGDKDRMGIASAMSPYTSDWFGQSPTYMRWYNKQRGV